MSRAGRQAAPVARSTDELYREVRAVFWYPRLWHGTPEERQHVELFGDGAYLHWPALDEDLTVAGLLAGRRSGESPQSLKRWVEARKAQGK